jgi:predicted RNA binding protein YcfA (HicA-like mRNA interferase family)/predicted RNase H-like HicB family nuclease
MAQTENWELRMPTKFRDLVRMPKDGGWEYHSAEGSHYTYKHPTKGRLIVPFHGGNKEIAPGTLKIDSEAGGVAIMARFTATVEQAGDGSWTAAIVGENTVLGVGDTREEALDDLRKGLAILIGQLKREGRPIPDSTIEVVSIEVAA